MSGWISSKLKVAETFLQQIDQTAATSLKKNDKLRLGDDNELSYNRNPNKNEVVLNVVPVKDQLKKRYSEPPLRRVESITGAPSSVPLTDNDWNNLLGSTSTNSLPNSVNRRNVVTPVRGLGKNMGKKPVKGRKTSGADSNSAMGANRRVVEKNAMENRKNGNGEESSSSDSVVALKFGEPDGDKSFKREEGTLHSINKEPTALGTTKLLRNDDYKDLRVDELSEIAIGNSAVPKEKLDKAGVLSSSPSSSSDELSSSDSEKEEERKVERKRRRDKINAEKAAKAVAEAIKEREDIVARLEGEKQSLEKILVERAEQQVQEASELQMSMMETMEAVELEKQRHNNTRMEALSRLAKLETANADLAKSLAATQWNLQIQVNTVAELRQEIELKEASLKELQEKMSKTHQNRSYPEQLEGSKSVEYELDVLETEYSFTVDKIRQLHEKEKMLEENIEITLKEIETPSEVEVELKRRLAQLTDHLIQKQSQVESLSSEKATLLFRIETVSTCLDEERSSMHKSDSAGQSCSDDLEMGMWRSSKSKRTLLLANKIQSGGQHLESLLRQLDAICCAGYAMIRRNSSLKWCSLFYITCLHLWVAYIFMSHSEVPDTTSGAIISIDNINKTTGS